MGSAFRLIVDRSRSWLRDRRCSFEPLRRWYKSETSLRLDRVINVLRRRAGGLNACREKRGGSRWGYILAGAR